MAFLILYIETIPRPTIDKMVEETVAKKVQTYIDRTGNDPENEESTLRTFFEIINHGNTKGVCFVHYNGLGFDISFLIIRTSHYGIEINNWNFTDLRRFSYKSHIDLMMYLCNWNNYNAISMDVTCRSF